MFCDSPSSSRKQNSNPCSIAPGNTNANISSGLTVSLATAAICILASNQAVAATDFNTHFNLSAQDDHHADYQHDSAAGFLPRIIGLLPMSVQAQITNWSQRIAHTEHHQHSPNYGGMGGSLIQDLTPLYLSQARSSSTKQFGTVSIKPIGSSTISLANRLTAKPQPQLETYTVKAGDTINRIAKEHRVSRDEIIKLNNIKNSNIIFVSQRLQIPVTKTKDTTSKIPGSQDSSQITVTAGSFPTNSASETKLRSSVSSRRVARTKQNATPKSYSPKELATHRAIVDNANTSNLEQKRLARLNEDLKRIRAESRQNPSLNNEPILSSIIPESNQDSESVSATAVSLQLPPLPPSEEYLPNAFDGYAWPAKGVLTSGYGWRWGRLHKGIDIAAPVGTPVFAAASGEVISAGWNSGGYGNLVKLRHLDGSVTIYAHNNKILVNSGQEVAQGDQIAEMGNTGFSTGSHLHFEIHSREQGAINPLALLN